MKDLIHPIAFQLRPLTFLPLAALLCVATATAQPGTAQATTGYAQDAHGSVVRSGSGLCWRLGNWSANQAAEGCDDGPVAKPIAVEDLVKPKFAPPTPPVALIQPAPAQVRCDFSAVLENDQIFGFGQAALNPAARLRIDRDVVAPLARCGSLDRIVVAGHTDPIGSAQANARLSQRRADAVKSYLVAQGVAADKIEAVGMGATQPLPVHCDGLPRTRMIACLAPQRRVSVEVSGLAP